MNGLVGDQGTLGPATSSDTDGYAVTPLRRYAVQLQRYLPDEAVMNAKTLPSVLRCQIGITSFCVIRAPTFH